MSATVVLLTYNGEKFLLPMLDSLYNQTYRPIQLLIADDASTDGTKELLLQYKKEHEKDSNFTIELVLRDKNLGRSGNRNGIIGDIKGDYVFLADQDDIWNPQKIEKQIAFLEKHENCFGVSCDRRLISQDDQLLLESENSFRKHKHIEVSDLQDSLKFKSNFPANCIGFRNKDIVKTFSIPSQMEEPDRFLRVMLACVGDLGYVDEPLVNYRIHMNNLSGNYFEQINKNPFKVFRNYLNKNRRFNRIFHKDDLLILEEVKKRFDLDLSGQYTMRKRKLAFFEAVGHVAYDIINGNLGAFIK